MYVTARADYALRAAIELAAADATARTVAQIAAAQDIPPRFLENILLVLRRARLLDSRRGSEGGFRLARLADLTLVSPPIALSINVLARILPEIGRAEDEDLEALRPRLVASPRTRRDAHSVPFLDLHDLVAEFHPPAPTNDHIHLLLRPVGMSVRKAITGRDALVGQPGFLQLKRLGCRAELQVRRAVKHGADVLQIRLEVRERERHGTIL